MRSRVRFSPAAGPFVASGTPRCPGFRALRLHHQPRRTADSASGDLGRQHPQIPDTHEIVGRSSEGKDSPHPEQLPMFQLAQHGSILQPSKAFLDSLSPSLTEQISRVMNGPRVDCAATSPRLCFGPRAV